MQPQQIYIYIIFRPQRIRENYFNSVKSPKTALLGEWGSVLESFICKNIDTVLSFNKNIDTIDFEIITTTK